MFLSYAVMKTKSKDSRLVFTNVCVKIKKKEILRGISGVADSGEVLAIMGPTGSGKTTLLNALSGQVPYDPGTVALNGAPMTKSARRRIGYCIQEDILHVNLTLYETLYFTAMLRIPETVSYSEKMARIDEIAGALNIKDCLKTKVGDFLVRGLSGGEKKRANIACELLADPDIMLVDEPTSGLDSSTALLLIQQLKSYATIYNKSIIATIHQPSSQMFHTFNKLLLMVNGLTAYFGNAKDAVTFFQTLNVPQRPLYNPADYLMELLTSGNDIIDQMIHLASEERQGDTFALNQNHNAQSTSEFETLSIGMLKKGSPRRSNELHLCSSVPESVYDIDRNKLFPSNAWPTGFWTQYRMLAWRNYKQVKGRILRIPVSVSAIWTAAIMGLMYFQISNELDTLRDRMGMIFICVVYWGTKLSTIAIMGFSEEREVVTKERRMGAYRLSAYYLAKISSELPLLVTVPIIFYSISYWMAMIGGVSQFFIFIGVNLMHCLCIQGFGHLFGAVLVDARTAVLWSQTFNICTFLTAGFFNTHFPPWLTWVKYVSFMHYPYAAMVTSLLSDVTPIPCNQTAARTFEVCEISEYVTGQEILKTIGVELPIYCYLATLTILIFLLKVLGYYALKLRGA